VARYPHLIKLVRSVTTYTDGGYYAAIYYRELESFDGIEGGTFFLLNPFSPPDALATDNYEVYTTKGTLAMVSNDTQAYFSFAARTIYTVTNDPSSQEYSGDLSCKPTLRSPSKFRHILTSVTQSGINDQQSLRSLCLDKSDIITFLNPSVFFSANNPPHINLYRVQALRTVDPQWSTNMRYPGIYQVGGKPMTYMTNQIHVDLATNWGSSDNEMFSSPFKVFKFFPHATSSYEYVAQCSNRGMCNANTGLCECFKGYSGDDCHEQNVLAM